MSANPFLNPMEWERHVVSHYTRLTTETSLEAVLMASTTEKCHTPAAMAHTASVWMVRFEENAVLESFKMFCKHRHHNRCFLSPKYYPVNQNVHHERHT